MARGTEWLYEPVQEDKEEYLLGKRIDKHTNATSLHIERVQGPSGGVVDLANKVKEDPLFMIKRSEEAKRKEIVSNPVKVSQIKRLVEKKNKHKKSSRERSRSPHGHTRHSSRPHTSHSDTRHSSRPHSDARHSSRPHTSHSDARHSSRPHTSHSDARHSSRPHTSHTNKALDKEEMERKRQEMMDNARAYGKQRQSRAKHAHMDEEEEEGSEQGPHFLQSLRVKSLSSSSSVADRIHRNIQSVQRTKARLDTDFL